jgi:branched-chain amino acid transport system substrate-binding protein
MMVVAMSLAAPTLMVMGGCDTGTKTATATSGSTGGAGNGATATGDTIPIGVVVSQTGANRPWGVDCADGAKLAVDEFNAAGGVNGKKVNLITADDASKPEEGKSATEKLVGDDKVLAVVGEVASNITEQMGSVCKEKNIPIVAVGATNVTLNDRIGSEFFRVCYTDALQGPAMAVFAYKKLGLRNVALMTDKKTIYSTGLSDAFRAEFTKLGGKIVDEQFYETGQTNFTGQLTNLQAKSPDGVFASGYFAEVGPLVKQAAEAGLKVPFFGGDGWDSREIVNTGGSAIIGDYYCNHYVNDDPSPEVQNFLKKWEAAHGGDKPGTAMGALGYDATAIVLDAMKKAKTVDSAGIRDALDNEEGFKGVSGEITLKGMHGNPNKSPIIVKLAQDGTHFAYKVDPKDISK